MFKAGARMTIAEKGDTPVLHGCKLCLRVRRCWPQVRSKEKGCSISQTLVYYIILYGCNL
uniref:Uncharacterized protein n=1 Tax=Rhizophora mucronata TaxID=61149 RepID=A0A2P2MS36_RHIMU